MTEELPIIRPAPWPFGRPRGYHSVDEALAAAGSTPREIAARETNEQVVGTTIRDHFYTRQEVGLLLSNENWLRIFVGQSTLEWEVTPAWKIVVPDTPCPLGPRCRMIWTRSLASVWEREALFRARLGKQIKMFHAWGHDVFVYVPDMLIMCFSPLGDEVRRDAFVYWDEDD